MCKPFTHMPVLYINSLGVLPIQYMHVYMYIHAHVCFNQQDLCCQQYDEGMVDDMCQRLEAYERGGALDREMRSLIVLHCRYCQGSGCKVPHLAAGW